MACRTIQALRALAQFEYQKAPCVFVSIPCLPAYNAKGDMDITHDVHSARPLVALKRTCSHGTPKAPGVLRHSSAGKAGIALAGQLCSQMTEGLLGGVWQQPGLRTSKVHLR